VALFWNTPDTADDTALRHAIDAVYARLRPDENVLPSCGGLPTPDQDETPTDLAFGPPVRRHIHWSQAYTTAEWIDLLETHSNHRLMEPEVRTRVLAEVAEVIDAHGGIFDARYDTVLWGAQRR
jgi:hypothetical protein